MARVLGRIRLSRLRDESTGEERQREAIETWAKMHGHVVVGWAVDIDVSGSVDPFETPEFGRWLTYHHHLFDVICAYRLDRISRRVIPLNALFGWVQEHEKSLATVSESIDLSTWVGRLVANVIGGVAEGELEAIQERTTSSQEKIRKTKRWHGGTPPYGYETYQNGSGYYLRPNPDEAKIIQWVVEQVVSERRSINSLATELNDQGVPTRKGTTWAVQPMFRMLRSPALLGWRNHDKQWRKNRRTSFGTPVKDEEGIPLQVADPIISYATWRKLQEVLDQNKTPRKRAGGVNLLRNVVYCSQCDHPLYRQIQVLRGTRYEHLKCRHRYVDRESTCTASAVQSRTVEQLTEEYLMEEIGDIPRTVNVFVPGDKPSDDLAQVEEAIKSTRREKDFGLYEGDENSYIERLQKLTQRRDTLKETPIRESRWERQEVGETYRQAWERMGLEEKRDMLLDCGIKVWTEGNPWRFRVYIPEDILEQQIPGYTPELEASEKP